MKSNVSRNLTVLLLLLVMLICPAVSVYATSYSDIESTSYQNAVEILSDMGVIDGYPDGTYQPTKSVTRAEFSAMISKYLGASESTLASYKETNYKDMIGYSWSIPYIGYCSDKGIINGDGKGNVMPGNTITYAQAITMIVRTLGLESELNASQSWPTNYLEIASKHGLSDGVAASGSIINRGDAALLLHNALNTDSSYTGNVTVNKLSLYRISGSNQIVSYKFARNLDSEIIVKFTLNHDKVNSDKILPVQLLISPTVEKKVIENETKYIKLLANTESTEVSTSISIKDLIKDNLNVKQYKLEIKANNTVLDLETLELYVDTSEEEALINNSNMKIIKFFSGNSQDWIPYEDREYAVSFLKTQVLSIIGTEVLLEHEYAKRDMTVPINFTYYFNGEEFAVHNFDQQIDKGTTNTKIDFGIYFGQFQTKKYQAGNYTVKAYSFDKQIAEGKFSVVIQ